MLSFKNFIREFYELLEDRIDFLKQNLEGKLGTDHDPYGVHKTTSDIVDHFAGNADPTKNKAHTQWILNQYRRGKIRQEDHPRIREALSNFELHKKKLPNGDINSFKSLSDVEDAVQPFLGQKEPVSKKQSLKKIKEKGSTLLSNRNGVSVRRLETKAAACQYGKNTKWCTAAEKGNMFNQYKKQGSIYYIEGRDENGDIKKYQYHPHSGQFMDEKDTTVSIPDFVTRNPEITEHPELHHLRVYGPHATPDDIEKSLNSDKSREKFLAAKHKNATEDQITRALQHENVSIREGAAGNPNATPVHITTALSDRDPEVRMSAAKNPRLTTAHLETILGDKSQFVRLNAASHPKLTPAQLQKALSDESPGVRKHALKNPNITTEQLDTALGDSDPKHRQQAASSQNVTQAHLDRAINDEDHNVRSAAYMNPRATKEHIERGLTDPHPYARVALTRRPDLSREHLEKLINDPHPAVYSDARQHPLAKTYGLV